MKKIINTLLAITLLGTGATVFAENGAIGATASSTNPRPRVEARQEIRNIRSDARTEIRDVRAEAREQVREFLEKRATHRWSQMIERFEKAIDKEETLLARIVSRIEKIKVNGGNTADAEKYVGEARTHLAEAKTALETLKTLASEAITKEEARANATEIREKMKAMKKAMDDVKLHLIETHKALQKAVGSLRGLSQLRNASSTSAI